MKASGLTPPLEARLLRELERLDWLRLKASEEWDGATAALEVDGPDRASALFLLRPEGWLAEMSRIAWEAGGGAGAAVGDRVAHEAEKLRAERTELRARLKEASQERDALRQEVRRLERSATEPVRADLQGAARHRERLVETEAERARERSEHQRVVAELRAEVQRHVTAERKAREERAAMEAKLEQSRLGPGWSRGGAGLARSLDSLAAAAVRVIPEAEAGVGAVPLSLPRGVSPDTAEAVDRVLDHGGPKHLVIDGYNVGLALASGQAAEVRARLDPVLARLRTLARPPRSVAVVYDSSLEGSSVRGVAGVVVRFAPPGTSADDVIVGLAAVPGTVVISNDREVRERATRAGALALWAEALVAWSRQRR